MEPVSGRYGKLDLPEVAAVMFHPRPELPGVEGSDGEAFSFAVAEGIEIGGRFHLAGPADPHILFFHGNGEIVADYDDIGGHYVAHGLNFLAVDYRGYGTSSGVPSASTMIADAHVVFRRVREWMAEQGRTGPLLLMGRSLGTASAVELATAFEEDVAGLIIESGFATTMPLLIRLGVDVGRLGIREADCFNNVLKIERFTKPTFILHAQNDQIIPVQEAAILQAQCAAKSKELQIVPGADHNSILAVAGMMYFEVIRRFVHKACGIHPPRRRYRS